MTDLTDTEELMQKTEAEISATEVPEDSAPTEHKMPVLPSAAVAGGGAVAFGIWKKRRH